MRRLHRRHFGMALTWSVAIHGAVLLGLMKIANIPGGPGLLEVFPVTVATSDGEPAAADDAPAGLTEPSSRGALAKPTEPPPEPQQPAPVPARNGPQGATRTASLGTRRASGSAPPGSSEEVIVATGDGTGSAASQQLVGPTVALPEPPASSLELEPANVILPVANAVAIIREDDPVQSTSTAAREVMRERPSAPVRAAAADAPTVGRTSAAMGAGSPLGLVVGRVRVQLEGPRARVTDRSSETVSGNIFGGTPERLVLYVNDAPQEVPLDGRSFKTSVALATGQNRLRAVVTGVGGTQAEDAVSVEYVATEVDDGLALVSPRDGHALAVDDPPLVVVEGELRNATAAELWVVANDRRISVSVRERRFRAVVPVFESVTRVWAEIGPRGGPLRRSETVTVHAAASRRGAGLLVMDWSAEAAGLQADVSAVWRAESGSLEPAGTPVSLEPLRSSPGSPLPAAFSLGPIRPGVYAFMLTVRTGAAEASVRPTLYWPENGTVKHHVLRPMSLAGPGRSVVTRVLLPHGVLWDQEEWFTGKSESVDTITKFRFPEGTTWVERKKELQ